MMTNALKHSSEIREESGDDNYISHPLHDPLHQKVSLLSDRFTTQKVAQQIARRNETKEDWDESFFVGDIGRILDQYKRWKRELPRVEVFYAVKANSLRPVIRTMAALGCGFDCASKNEIALVLSSGIQPDKIIYAHPCKMISHLMYAKDNDVNLMTFDNEEELNKIKGIFPSARLVLRIETDDEGACTTFGRKFGASVEYGKELVERAKKLGLRIFGISFHVGSGCPKIKSFTKAIEDSKRLFDFAAEVGFEFKLLDIGGGFPRNQQHNDLFSFESMASVIREGLDKHFPAATGVNIIAEPGRYFPGPAFLVATNVSAKRITEDHIYYHVGDGIYNSFASFSLENWKLQPYPLEPVAGDPQCCTVFGVTCSGRDIIARNVMMKEVQVGDWIVWKDAGAYSSITRFGFNGFVIYKARYFITQSKLKELQEIATHPNLLPLTTNSV